VLAGTYSVSPVATIIASTGLILSTVYALWMVQATFQGPARAEAGSEPARGSLRIADLGVREMIIAIALVLAIVWLGVYPQSFVDAASPVVAPLAARAAAVTPVR
jgi:NADH-quinone oxidoreductase subunit M